jgi:hypothetical protein
VCFGVLDDDLFCSSAHCFAPGLSYRASGGLLAGEPGRKVGGLVHYALYEPGRVL